MSRTPRHRALPSSSRPSSSSRPRHNSSHAAMDAFFDISAPVPSEVEIEPSRVPADYDHSNGSAAWSCTIA